MLQCAENNLIILKIYQWRLQLFMKQADANTAGLIPLVLLHILFRYLDPIQIPSAQYCCAL